MPGSHTTKKQGGSIRKINNDFQKDILKGFPFKQENELASIELSARTPGKFNNAELSPYVMDFYNKKNGVYKDSLVAKLRSSGNNLKFKNSVKEYDNDIINEKRLISKHKKSKSQTAFMGSNIEKHASNQNENHDESTYTTQIKVNTKRAI